MMKTVFVNNVAISSATSWRSRSNFGSRQRGTSVSLGVMVGAIPSMIPRMKNRGFANLGVAAIVKGCVYQWP